MWKLIHRKIIYKSENFQQSMELITAEQRVATLMKEQLWRDQFWEYVSCFIQVCATPKPQDHVSLLFVLQKYCKFFFFLPTRVSFFFGADHPPILISCQSALKFDQQFDQRVRGRRNLTGGRDQLLDFSICFIPEKIHPSITSAARNFQPGFLFQPASGWVWRPERCRRLSRVRGCGAKKMPEQSKQHRLEHVFVSKKVGIRIPTWLVVWLPFFIFPYIGCLIIPTD